MGAEDVAIIALFAMLALLIAVELIKPGRKAGLVGDERRPLQ